MTHAATSIKTLKFCVLRKNYSMWPTILTTFKIKCKSNCCPVLYKPHIASLSLNYIAFQRGSLINKQSIFFYWKSHIDGEWDEIKPDILSDSKLTLKFQIFTLHTLISYNNQHTFHHLDLNVLIIVWVIWLITSYLTEQYLWK